MLFYFILFPSQHWIAPLISSECVGLNHHAAASPKFFFFSSFFTSCFTFFVLFRRCFISPPPKTFEQLYMKCVVVALVVVFFFLFDIIGCVQTSCALTLAFKNPFQVSFLRLPSAKRLTGATLFFFLSHQSFISVAFRFGKGADCTHTNYDPRCLWALYPVFTFHLWAKRRWLCPSGSRWRLKGPMLWKKKVHWRFSLFVILVTELSRKEESAGCHRRATYSLSWRVFHNWHCEASWLLESRMKKKKRFEKRALWRTLWAKIGNVASLSGNFTVF